MKHFNLKEILVPPISLFVVCVVVSIFLAATNILTQPRIGAQKAKSNALAKHEVMPTAKIFKEKTLSGKEYSVGLNDQGETLGYLFCTEAKGYSGTINIMIGILKDSTISGIKILSHNETPGLGANIENKTFIKQFIKKAPLNGFNLKNNNQSVEGVNAITGATISSNLLVEAIQNALNGKLPVQNGGSNTDTTEDLFRAQCEAAGVTVPEYVDPNAPIYEAEGTVAEGEADVVTGASGVGSDYYPGAGSYQTLEYMYNRFSIKYYYSVTWKESATAIEGTTASTLEEAAALPNAKYIRQEFPNDGKNYSISMSGNALSSKTLITQDAEGNMTAAIYGLGIKKDDNGNYFVTGSITNKKTVANLLATDKALLVVYEYNPTDPDKMGAGNRNFGCRLVLTLDRQQTIFGQVVDGKYVMGDPVGDAKEIPENSDFISVSLKVEEMWTIG